MGYNSDKCWESKSGGHVHSGIPLTFSTISLQRLETECQGSLENPCLFQSSRAPFSETSVLK